MQDRSLDLVHAHLLAIPLFIALAAAVIVPHWWLWSANPLSVVLKTVHPFILLGVFVAGAALHEAVHGATFVAVGGLKRSDLMFGVQWRTLTPFAHPRVPVPARVYRIAIAMPGLILGALPALAGIIYGISALSAWGAVFLAAASGDLLALITLGTLPGSVLVQDHPTRLGCEIAESSVPKPIATHPEEH